MKLSKKGGENMDDLKKETEDLLDFCDTIDKCITKLSLLRELFKGGSPNSDCEISWKAGSGIYFILMEVEEDMEHISDEISKKIREDKKFQE
jgi:hypothetical protein